MENIFNLPASELYEEFEKWLDSQDTAYFGAPDEEYVPQPLEAAQEALFVYQPTDKAVLEAIARSQLTQQEEPTLQPRELKFPPPLLDLPPVHYCQRDTSFRVPPNPAEAFRPITIEAERRPQKVHIPDGPIVDVPPGVKEFRARHGGLQWRIRVDARTGAVRHIGKPKRKIFF